MRLFVMGSGLMLLLAVTLPALAQLEALRQRAEKLKAAGQAKGCAASP